MHIVWGCAGGEGRGGGFLKAVAESETNLPPLKSPAGLTQPSTASGDTKQLQTYFNWDLYFCFPPCENIGHVLHCVSHPKSSLSSSCLS